MADNRFNSLNEYEQLKRKNRRRLVGASVMVVLAGVLLAKVLNQGENKETVQNISIGASDVQTASSVETGDVPQVAINNQAASADDASDLSPAAVLEPAPEGSTRSTELANPLADGMPQNQNTDTTETAADPDTVFERAVVNEPADETPAAASPPAQTPQQTAKPQTAPQAAAPETAPRRETAAPPPVVVINNRNTAQQAAEKAAAGRKAEQARAAQQAAEARAREARQAAIQKEAELKKARQAKQQAARAEAQKQAETKKKQQAAAQQSKPQDILNNKAATAAAKPDPKAILEGRSTAAAAGGKALIQAGAYSSRDQARQTQQKLANAGVSAYISEAETSKGTVYRVRTGNYASRAAADRDLAKIRQQGVDGMVIGQ
ncbi:SPOR domain-containing protein [Uruburuella testudinis]|uniref:SPOR domain-containing protein n=1 Tax=Uruburuella testudinis TaxID=1282863 RepID=A0ABY4DWI3_9NEIS|nr:SPOR domain-containing protein [Uruburuella testudinis]UOO83153.1 SPOR domain-containing protein [Uruburuella testudinis]